MSLSASPSRRYVAMCNNPDFSGHYFKRFVLPADLENSVARAQHHFLNTLDTFACVHKVITAEEYENVTEA